MRKNKNPKTPSNREELIVYYKYWKNRARKLYSRQYISWSEADAINRQLDIAYANELKTLGFTDEANKLYEKLSRSHHLP